eukprot:COSAG01_NODE_6637_length_3568_cov_4.555780_1_plen_411_part_00
MISAADCGYTSPRRAQAVTSAELVTASDLMRWSSAASTEQPARELARQRLLVNMASAGFGSPAAPTPIRFVSTAASSTSTSAAPTSAMASFTAVHRDLRLHAAQSVLDRARSTTATPRSPRHHQQQYGPGRTPSAQQSRRDLHLAGGFSAEPRPGPYTSPYRAPSSGSGAVGKRTTGVAPLGDIGAYESPLRWSSRAGQQQQQQRGLGQQQKPVGLGPGDDALLPLRVPVQLAGTEIAQAVGRLHAVEAVPVPGSAKVSPVAQWGGGGRRGRESGVAGGTVAPVGDGAGQHTSSNVVLDRLRAEQLERVRSGRGDPARLLSQQLDLQLGPSMPLALRDSEPSVQTTTSLSLSLRTTSTGGSEVRGGGDEHGSGRPTLVCATSFVDGLRRRHASDACLSAAPTLGSGRPRC